MTTATLSVRVLKPAGSAYAWLELAVETTAEFRNPFAPAEVEVWALFTGPTGTARVGGFWYQGFERRLAEGNQQVLTPAGDEPGFRIRFTPTVPGEYRSRVFLRNAAGEVESAEGPAFTVAPSDHPGFVGVSAKDSAYFAYRSGQTFLPVGINMGWGHGGRTYDFDRWCEHLAAAGGNFIRVWMSSWAFSIESGDTGPGNYTGRLDRAWELDHIFSLCERLGIQVMLVLVNHGYASTFCNEDWDKNAYNSANPGGFVTNAEEFFTDARAREFFRRRLRYIIARWGHSPSLMTWELFNEVDLTDGFVKRKAAVGEWHGEMARHIKGLDPYGHLVGSSYMGDTRDPLLWNVPELDFVQYHTYGHKDLSEHIAWVAQDLGRYGRPVTIAEFGTDTQGADTKDQDGVWLREGLWSAVLGKSAGSGWPWWWDTCVEPLGLWRHWATLSAFLKGEQPDAEGYRYHRAASGLEAHALVGERRALLWAKNPAYTWEKAPGPYTPAPAGTIELPLAPGPWQVQWWSPATGQVVSEETVTAGPAGLALAHPTVAEDLAAKLWRL